MPIRPNQLSLPFLCTALNKLLLCCIGMQLSLVLSSGFFFVLSAATSKNHPTVQRLLASHVPCVSSDFLIEFIAKPSQLAKPLLKPLLAREEETEGDFSLPSPLPHVLFGCEAAMVAVLTDLKARLAKLTGGPVQLTAASIAVAAAVTDATTLVCYNDQA